MPTSMPLLMGIVNVTPDSFSDGGRFLVADQAIDHAKQLLDEGADWIDVGGESTRPGAERVVFSEELRRVLPVVEQLARIGANVSIDTSKVEVARRCLEAGAKLVNDVTGLRQPEMVELCAEFRCGVCIMHMQGMPQTMQAHPVYGDVVRDVKEYLLHAASVAESVGVERKRIWIDPGFGFGKSTEHNRRLLADLDQLTATPYPVLVGLSRKSFLGRWAARNDGDPLPVGDRLEASIAAHVVAIQKGAHILRVHDVAATLRAMRTIQALGV